MNQAEKERLARVGKIFNAKKYIKEEIEAIKKQVGDKKVLLALSGGVDSSVCAALLYKAIGKQLVCVFVDHGCMRLNEGKMIKKVFRQTPRKSARSSAANSSRSSPTRRAISRRSTATSSSSARARSIPTSSSRASAATRR